jgi:hypothetical protein
MLGLTKVAIQTTGRSGQQHAALVVALQMQQD